MIHPQIGEFIILNPVLRKLQFNSDLFGTLAWNSQSYDCYRVVLLLKLFQKFLKDRLNRGTVCRNLHAVLCPIEKKNWQRVVLAYYIKKLCTGGRPVQEFPFMEKMFWALVIREFCAQKQFPSGPKQPKENELPLPPIHWDFDETPLGTNGQDCDIGDDEGNLWSSSELDMSM